MASKTEVADKASKAEAAPVTFKRTPRAGELKAAILDALADGELSGLALATACGTGVRDRTFGRARRGLVSEGKIKATGEGRGARYRLASQGSSTPLDSPPEPDAGP